MESALAAVKRFGVSTKRAHLALQQLLCTGGIPPFLAVRITRLRLRLWSNPVEPRTPPRQKQRTQQSLCRLRLPKAIPETIVLTVAQYTLDLITSGDGDVPLYLRVGNGNDADQAVFTEVLAQFRASVESRQT